MNKDMVEISRTILKELYPEILEEQKIDYKSCRVFTRKDCSYEGYPYGLYVSVNGNAVRYWGDDLADRCFEVYYNRFERGEK